MEQKETSHLQRINMINEKNAGKSLSMIASEMNLNYYTVRKWWRHYRDEGWTGVAPKQRGCVKGKVMSRFHPLVKYVALKLKRGHPGWGADMVLLHMSRRESLKGLKLPKRSLLYKYFKQFYPRFSQKRLMPAKAPQQTAEDTQEAHDRWQIDFKGDVLIEEDVLVSPLILCDEHTSAPLYSKIMPFRYKSKHGLTSRDIQDCLRQAFTQWGLPRESRMDRDPLWVGGARLQWPGIILLWLAGLGIKPVINRPGRPTDNAQIERNNRCWKEHVYSGQKHDCESMQAMTDSVFKDRREHLPSRNPHCKGLPPAIANPCLMTNARAYCRNQEVKIFDIQKVYSYLALWKWERKVDKVGRITINSTTISIGRKYTKQVVYIHLDEQTKLFNAYCIDKIKLKSFQIPNITPEFIMGNMGT